MRFGKKFVVGLAAILAPALLLMAGPSAYAADKPIKIGMIDCYTGAAAAFCKPALMGWQMAVEEINEKGGINGRKIEILVRDDKFKPDEALAHAKELVLKENVDFLAGTTNSASALAVSEFAKQKKKVFMVHIARSDRITGAKGHRYIFRGCPSADLEGFAGGAYAATLPFKKWYILAEDYEYGHSIAKTFWEGLKKNKPDVEKVGEAWTKVGETDYTSYMTALQGKNPDAVYIGFGASGLLAFARQAKVFGLIEKVPIFGFGLADSTTPMVLKEDTPEGLYGASNYLWYYPADEANKAFVAKAFKFSEKAGTPNPYPSGIGVFAGYTCAKFIIDAVTKAGAVDSEKVVDALEGLSIDTPIGKIAMRKCDHQAETPTFWGKMVKVEGFPFPVVKDVVMTPGAKTMPSCEEIEAARK